MAQKPSIPKGTRDFSAAELSKRDYIFKTIKTAFQKFGFQPIETPAFENSSTLLGKYGEEGDRLIFKILNSGEFLKKVDITNLKEKNSQKIASQISDKALRYDLTVPFARYVVQYQNDLEFPFKRYQMQPVWRADRPQKGRFREFFQCDADVVGSTSLWQEVAFIQLYDEVFSKLGLSKPTIKFNNRKVLSGIAQMMGAKDQLIDFTVALDKLDKIGKAGVIKEMSDKGISNEAIQRVKPLLDLKGDNRETLAELKVLLKDSVQGLEGVAELEFVLNALDELKLKTAQVKIDITLARGLNYYTGAIFEVMTDQVDMGSIGGGGRYDDLTGIFGLKGMSGIGISFGLDRIYLVLEELDLFSKVNLIRPEVLFLNFGDKEALYCLKAIAKLRNENIKTELYPDNTKLKKQLNYANKRNIPYTVLVGSSELDGQEFTLKNMETGEQQTCNLETLIKIVKNS